ncbi:hypothetical protein [Ponticaulis sp.]|uniref:hypothetical protein n=1 Tax=Ponticaulis sp. TaxID=2020902 RepID=UPI00262C6F63|nr:hypothetical protein [Ponticaulis sp.]MDF1679133.1 hypothetical protein [Ponticaulis sp.]
MIEGIGKILNGVLFFLIVTAASLAFANPEKIGIREEPLRDLPPAPAAVTRVDPEARCRDLARAWEYMQICAPENTYGIQPGLLCTFDRPRLVEREPESLAIATMQRDFYRTRLVAYGCVKPEPGEEVLDVSELELPEISGEERQSRLQGLMQRAQGDGE